MITGSGQFQYSPCLSESSNLQQIGPRPMRSDCQNSPGLKEALPLTPCDIPGLKQIGGWMNAQSRNQCSLFRVLTRDDHRGGS